MTKYPKDVYLKSDDLLPIPVHGKNDNYFKYIHATFNPWHTNLCLSNNERYIHASLYIALLEEVDEYKDFDSKLRTRIFAQSCTIEELMKENAKLKRGQNGRIRYM